MRRLAHRPFDVSLALGEISLLLWLWYACGAFTGAALAWWPDAFVLGAASMPCSWLLGLHARPSAHAPAAYLGRSAVPAPVLAVLILAVTTLQGARLTPGFALWIGSAAACLHLGFRLSFWAARSRWPDQRGEILRWLAVGGTGFLLLFPFYGRQKLGSADGYWYVEMIADFIAQLHHGVFPVWIGQSEYAFIGAVTPLRLAPWLQYSAGFWDLLTLHRLEPTALKNATTAASGLATAASAYLAIRLALPRRPSLACLLALLWTASPAVLAPLYAGDQYMQWVAMPFLPPLLLGCWRLWTRDDRAARFLIALGLSGMMLGHTPTALWGALLAGGLYLAHLLVRRNWAAEGGQMAVMATVFLVLGAFPIGSAFSLDNTTGITLTGDQVPPEIARVFPGNFEPINGAQFGLNSYQVGYALLAAGVLALALLAWLRPRGGAAFAGAILAIVPLTLPVPGVTRWIWEHTPDLIVSITNVWPTQRLFHFWGLTMVFALILALGDPRLGRRFLIALGVILLVGGAWSAREAAKLVVGIRGTFVPPDITEIYLRPENLQLTRYVYAPFLGVPAYASHAHVDPVLENRLLDAKTLRVMAANADAAAPLVSPESDSRILPRIAQSGVWVATSDNRSRFYKLAPPLRLNPGQSYALRLDFLEPDKEGILQIYDHDLFREYLLPESGTGLASAPPMGFGSRPTSSHVAALEQTSPAAIEPLARIIVPRYVGERFDFARFWLYAYDLANLPVRVSSWIPYRAETETAIPAYLETPRIWQRAWRAEVNGRRVATRESPQHLTMIPLEPGTSRVSLTYHAPLWLSAWFWLCLAGWLALFGWCLRRIVHRAFLTDSPARTAMAPLPFAGSGR